LLQPLLLSLQVQLCLRSSFVEQEIKDVAVASDEDQSGMHFIGQHHL
jgi:hypothetical protein